MLEKMQAQIVAEVDDQSFKKAGNDMKLFARDTKKELDKSFLFKLQLDKANAKIELENVRVLLRKAKKEGDEALVLKYTLKTDQLQSKLTEAGRSLNNFVNTGDTKVSRLGALFNKLGLDISKLSPGMQNVVNNFNSGISQMSGGISNLTTKIGALAIGTGLLAIGKQALILGDRLEQANISFTTMLGSAEKAKVLLGDLATFASNTPFELVGLRDTAKQLLAFGIDSDQIIPTLKALGDVSAGLSVPIGQVAYAFGQVKVAGRLMGGELMQFTNAGVPLIAELSKNLGVAQSDIKKMVSDGKIGFADVANAFKTMTQEGGKFNDLMDKQTETLSGKWSNAVDNMNLKLEALGTSMLPFAKGIVDVINPILDWVVNVWKGLDGGLHLISMAILQSIYSIQIAWKNVTGSISILLNGLVGTLRDFGANTSILFENIGIGFGALPNALKGSLNKGITLIEGFLNKAGNGINNFAKKLGLKDDLIGKVSLGKLDIETNAVKFKSFKDTNKQIANERNLAQMEEIQSYEDLKNISKKINKEKTADYIQALFPYKGATKELNTELIAGSNDLAEKETKNSKKVADEKEKALKDELEQREKFAKYQEKKQKEEEERLKKRADLLEKGKDIISDYYNNLRDELEKSGDKIKDFDDKIKSSNEKILELQKGLSGEALEVGVSLEEKRLELIKTRIALEEKFGRGNLQTFSNTDDTTLTQIGTGTLSGGATGNDILEYKKTLEELAYIESQNALITDEVKAEASKTESQRLVEAYNEKKAKLDQELLDEQNRLIEFEANKTKEQEIYNSLDQYRSNLEKNFTSLLQNETTKRISELEKIRIKAIQTANALASAGITYNTNNEVSVNLQGTGYTSQDAYNISKTLTSEIDLSSKGINK